MEGSLSPPLMAPLLAQPCVGLHTQQDDLHSVRSVCLITCELNMKKAQKAVREAEVSAETEALYLVWNLTKTWNVYQEG